jgi:hypothetical protein
MGVMAGLLLSHRMSREPARSDHRAMVAPIFTAHNVLVGGSIANRRFTVSGEGKFIRPHLSSGSPTCSSPSDAPLIRAAWVWRVPDSIGLARLRRQARYSPRATRAESSSRLCARASGAARTNMDRITVACARTTDGTRRRTKKRSAQACSLHAMN